MPVDLAFYNRQRKIPVDTAAWAARLPSLHQAALPCPGPETPVLPHLTAIDVTFVGKTKLARLHGEFCGDPSPTDVITFPHGEILVCPQTAAEHAARLGHSVEEELITCVLHGFLHLNGWRDDSPEAARRMAIRQTDLVSEILGFENQAGHRLP